MANFMDSLWDSVWFQEQAGGTRTFDVVEHTDQFEISVAYPGATDVNVTVEDNVLNMHLAREAGELDESVSKYHVRGIHNYSFNKKVSLAKVNIDQEKISSSYKKGILTIVMPKSESAKPKVIAVKVDEQERSDSFCVYSVNPTRKGGSMYICEECGEQIRDFMIESYEMFVDVEENIEEYLCAGCLQEVTGEEID